MPASEAEAAGAAGPGSAVPKGTKAVIRETVAAAGDPTLDASASEALREALQPVIDRCRASRPDAAEAHVSVTLEVIAAKDVGVRIERATLPEGHPPDLVGCVREGLLGAKPKDIGQTGRLTATLEFGTS